MSHLNTDVFKFLYVDALQKQRLPQATVARKQSILATVN